MSYRVLIVDDDEIICRRITKLLKTYPDLVIDSASGNNAILDSEDLLSDYTYDFAVVDLNFSRNGRTEKNKRGFDIIKKIQDECPNCYTIVYSALIKGDPIYEELIKVFCAKGCCLFKMPINERKILEIIEDRIFYLEKMFQNDPKAKIGNLIYQKRNNKIYSIVTGKDQDWSKYKTRVAIWEYLMFNRDEPRSADKISQDIKRGTYESIIKDISRLNEMLEDLQSTSYDGYLADDTSIIYIRNVKGVGYIIDERKY